MIIYDLEGKRLKDYDLPSQFNETYHPDLIKRAVLTIQSNKRQKYGSFKRAGMRSSARISKRRKDFRGSYGHGISRVPRKVIWRRGTQFGWVGAFAPGTVGGRKAHPPKAEKNWGKKLNIKEKRKAIRSALSATLNKDLVENRNHILPKNFPLAVESKLENLEKIKDVKKTLENLGLKNEINRCKENKVLGPLIVVSKKCKLEKIGSKLEGVEIIQVNKINCELLAPGTIPGRLTVFTEESLDRLKKEKLFTKNPIKNEQTRSNKTPDINWKSSKVDGIRKQISFYSR